MKIFLVALVLGTAIGAAGGFVGGIFTYPYIFLADIVASEAAPDTATNKVLAAGRFIHANPSDPIHYGRGGVTIHASTARLEPDFEVGPGPKFHVYLVPNADVRTSDDVRSTMYVDLGRLKAFKGSQNYAIPAGVELSNFGSVVIWCEQFNVLISPASLKLAGDGSG